MTSSRFPFEIKELDPKDAAEIKQYTGLQYGFVTIGPKQYFLPQSYKHFATDIYNMEIRSTDVFVTTFPRSGTHVTKEMVWLVANDLDYDAAKSTTLLERFPVLHGSIYYPKELQEVFIKSYGHDEARVKHFQKVVCFPNSFSEVTSMPSPRFFHSHLPISLMPPTYLDTARVVYVMRDVRDVAVSYHLLASNSGWKRCYAADFKVFWNHFIRGFQQHGPYFEHVNEFWEKRHHPNLLFIFYEDLVKDMPSVINRVAKFLNKKLTEEQIAKLCQHLDIENFRKNASCNNNWMTEGIVTKTAIPFIRKGKVGGWREYFDEEMSSQAQRWIADNLRDAELRDRYLHL